MSEEEDKVVGQVRQVLYFPHQKLREVAAEVDLEDEGLEQLIEDLKATCKAYRADGLAATQIGEMKRVFVTDVGGNMQVFINPTIEVDLEVEQVSQVEGCLSFPSIHAKVSRWEEVDITAFDETGEERTFSMDGQEAIAVQHEFDHLDGVVMTDRMGKIQARQVKKQLAKFLKKYERSTKKKVKPSKRAAARKERKRQRQHRKSA